MVVIIFPGILQDIIILKSLIFEDYFDFGYFWERKGSVIWDFKAVNMIRVGNLILVALAVCSSDLEIVLARIQFHLPNTHPHPHKLNKIE